MPPTDSTCEETYSSTIALAILAALFGSSEVKATSMTKVRPLRSTVVRFWSASAVCLMASRAYWPSTAIAFASVGSSARALLNSGSR